MSHRRVLGAAAAAAGLVLAFAAPDAALADADDAVLESRITRATAGYHWPYAFQLRDLDACAPRGPEADRNGDVCWIVAYRAGGYPMNFVDVARIEIGPDGAGAGEFFIGAPFAADSTYSAVILGPANEVVSNAVSFEVVADDGGAVVAAATLRVPTGGRLPVELRGARPGTELVAAIHPARRDLGTIRTGRDGGWSGAIRIPVDLRLGSYQLAFRERATGAPVAGVWLEVGLDARSGIVPGLIVLALLAGGGTAAALARRRSDGPTRG